MTHGNRTFGELVVFGLAAALFFGIFLGIPYLWRLHSNRWAAPSLHPQTAITGIWVGSLAAPNVQTDYPKDPFQSDTAYRLGKESALQERRHNQMAARAVYLDLSLDPYNFGSPRLRAKVRMCAYNGAQADFQSTSMSVGDDGAASLVLSTKVSDEFGNLNLKLEGGRLQTEYQALDTTIKGVLVRGNLQDFQTQCDGVRSSATRDLAK